VKALPVSSVILDGEAVAHCAVWKFSDKSIRSLHGEAFHFRRVVALTYYSASR
jgi:hypothetical protein